tara:strand:- start:3675 stop:4823 length:1149 start_codon:yes stop_codon:yes gene_type:complete
MILYIFLFIVLTVLLCLLYLKIRYPFWSRQPVFHYYNLYYWLTSPGYLNYEFNINKYYDGNIEFNDYLKLNKDKKNELYTLVKNNYSPASHEYYEPTMDAIIDYFKGHNKKVYISMKYSIDTNKNKKCIGTMSSIPYEMVIYKNKMDIYYIDFLCVHKDYRKKGNAPLIIYSHAVNLYNMYKHLVYIFKREGVLSSYVPLTVYNTYIFDTKHWVKNASFKNNQYQLIDSKGSNISTLQEIFEDMETNDMFECIYKPNLNNINILIQNGHLIVFILMIDNNPYACYVYKNNHVSYGDNKCVDLIASYSNTSDEIFIMGYLNSLTILSKRITYNYLLIENISHNYILLKAVLERYSYKYKCDTGYYFYNYATVPFYSQNVFCIS